jgi:4-amino-4-deoxy-L-arabinose transferase-like glycosyltransferase
VTVRAPNTQAALLSYRLRASAVAARIVASWNTTAIPWNPLALIAAAWAVLTVPLVFFRGYNSDEGLAVSIARTALEDGNWLVPYVFNVRWVQRPTLLSWIIAAISAPFGSVSQITARLPLALSVLLGCLLIHWLLRKVAASVPAALFGAALFLACPLVIRSYVMITADLPLAVLLFLSFCLWWSGCEKGSVSFGRWLAVGIVLALAGLLKGPQPIAYFALGIGLYVLITRSWRQIPGLVMAGVICAIPLAAWYAAIYTPGDTASWAAFMRMVPLAPLPGPLSASFKTLIEALPAALAAAVFLAAAAAFRRPGLVRPGFVTALACYAFAASLVVLFWPGGSLPRYFLPMILPLCVLGGLGYDVLAARRPEAVAPLLVLTGALLFYALIYSALSPFLPKQYRQAQIEAARVTAAVQAAPAPIYRTGATALNVLPYVPGRILNATPDELAALSGPAWMVLPIDEAQALAARRPEQLHVIMPVGDAQQWRLLRLDKS